MFKLLNNGRRSSGSGGVAQANRRLRFPTKLHATSSELQHTPFQGPPGDQGHGMKSGSGRIDRTSK